MQRSLIFIVILGFALRLFGINWDQGFHLHPDERQLIFVADQINFFKNLNPNFFNYGSLPVYLLKGSAQLFDLILPTSLATYDGMLFLGRYFSILADLGTIYLIFKISLLLFKDRKIALFSSFFYAIAFFPIQNSHFFIVDTFLTFFITLLIFALLRYLKKPIPQDVVLIAFAAACAATTKITAVLFLPFIALVLFVKTKTLKDISIFSFFFLLFSFLFMPYAYLNWQKFLQDISLQLQLSSNPYIFPYTLQYVATVPYFYYLKNIFLWGLGPVIAGLSILGLFFIIRNLFVRVKDQVSLNTKYVMLTTLFYLFYFLVVGRSAVKFMRYMLPMYPFFAILAGYSFSKLAGGGVKTSTGPVKFIATSLILVFAVFWALMFVGIYSHKHTRIAATEWIHQNIPAGSAIAVEHWDDRLPLWNSERYMIVELPLYDQPDDERKWSLMSERLGQTDYLIIASNRLYVPLQRLADCSKYEHCYPRTAVYYQGLFSGNLQFEKVVEFSVHPGFGISDEGADESFTVYDHPKIMIFKRR